MYAVYTVAIGILYILYTVARWRRDSLENTVLRVIDQKTPYEELYQKNPQNLVAMTNAFQLQQRENYLSTKHENWYQRAEALKNIYTSFREYTGRKIPYVSGIVDTVIASITIPLIPQWIHKLAFYVTI